MDSDRVNILLIEDNPGDVRLIQEMLAAPGTTAYYVTAAERLQEGLALLDEDNFDVLLLDLGLPDSAGIDTLTRAQKHAPQLPIVVLTGLADQELAIMAMRQHAQDYLVKGEVDSNLLSRSVNYAIERKRSEEALRASEERFRRLFEDSKDAVFSSDKSGHFVDINPAGVELFGYPDKAALIAGVKLQNLYVNPAESDNIMRELDNRGYIRDYELGLKKRNGEEIIASATISVVPDKSGVVIGYQGILRDITQHRRLEQQLFQAQRLESIGRLAGGIAHDFNNFLTAAQGYIDLSLMELPPGNPTREDLAEARQSLERAGKLTQQLLLFGHREVIDLRPLDLNEVIDHLSKMLVRLIGEQYSLISALDADLWTIKADASHLEQVIMNLVMNARDAMPTGGAIEIGTSNAVVSQDYVKEHSGARTGNFVSLTVSDHGVGMDRSTLANIFEPFFSTKGAGSGTGLGLSVVYGIVTQHNGWIDVESEPGKGTNFTVYLPVFTAAEPRRPQPAANRGEQRGGGEKILLIEDNEGVRNLAEKMLSQSGYLVVKAANASEAIDAFDRQRGDFQLIFSDIILPDGDGVALVDQLGQRHPQLRVLLASGYSNLAVHNSIRQKGYRFIQKPYALDQLLAAIREAIEADQ